MPDQTQTMRFPSSLQGDRTSGMLLHITSCARGMAWRYGAAALHGSTGCMKRVRAGGRRCPWAQLDMATHPTALSSFASNGLLISPSRWLRMACSTRRRATVSPSSNAGLWCGDPFKHGLLDQAWGNFHGGAEKPWVRLTRSFVISRTTGWKTMRSSGP